MSWPWSELKLEPTDDARNIKRAYAKRLKDTRPDEDPEGFQVLYESYQAALDIARSGDILQFGVERAAPIADASDTAAQPLAEVSPESAPKTPIAEPHLEFLQDLYDLLEQDLPFAEMSAWDTLFERHPLDDLESHQQASIGAFAQLCEFGWNNRTRLKKRGKFRELLLRFDDRFDWSDQELELLELFPEEPAENLLRRLHYRASVLTREPIAMPDEPALPAWAWISLLVVFVVLWLIAGVQ